MIRERENDLVLCVCIVVTTLEYCNFEVVAFCGEISHCSKDVVCE